MLRATTLALTAVALTFPAVAQQSNQQQARQAQQADQEMSREARACLEDLQAIDQRLAEAGYGRAGPGGYGMYGAPYGRAAPPRTADDGTGALDPGATATPRADMYALMRAGYVMAATGHPEGCQAVVQAASDIGARYEEAIRTGDVDREELQRWRGEFLGSAVKVTELDRPLRTDEIIGTDVRNMRDEDLGDVEDVVLGPDGGVKYVIVSTGGFLGIGDNEVPVPWDELRLTVEPYRDTFVLDVDEQAFDQAPRLQAQDRDRLAAGELDSDLTNFWDDAVNR